MLNLTTQANRFWRFMRRQGCNLLKNISKTQLFLESIATWIWLSGSSKIQPENMMSELIKSNDFVYTILSNYYNIHPFIFFIFFTDFPSYFFLNFTIYSVLLLVALFDLFFNSNDWFISNSYFYKADFFRRRTCSFTYICELD